MHGLEASEQAWLDEYRHEIKVRHPGMVLRMLIYGSKARGNAGSDSDLDVLLVVKNEADRLRRSLRDLGYRLAVVSDTLPSIFAYTEAEWEDRRRRGFPFQTAVEHDGISVL